MGGGWGGVKNERNEWKGNTEGSKNRQEEGRGGRGGREQIMKTEDNEKKKGKCMVAEE